MASAAIWVNTSSRTLRALALLLSVVMAWAIVASANHLFIDMALGGRGGLALVAGCVAARIARAEKRRWPLTFSNER